MPSEIGAAFAIESARGANLAYLSYRIVGGRLMRDAGTVGRGGMPVICDAGFDGQPFDIQRFGGDVAAELASRASVGIVADFAREESPVLREVVGELARVAAVRKLPLYTSPAYEPYAPGAHVLIGSAVAEGSLSGVLLAACERYTPERVALEVMPTRTDFALPVGEGGGKRLSEAELAHMLDAQAPMSFFSSELCAKYFTYLAPDRRAHFVLYDDASTIAQKLRVAENCGVKTTFLLYAEVGTMLAEVCAAVAVTPGG